MQKTITNLKEEYIDYYRDCPIQKYAAEFIGRDEDTIMRWRKKDHIFADSVKRARAQWVRKRVMATKAEFALEKLEKEMFSQNNVDRPLPPYENEKLIDIRSPEGKSLSEQFTEYMLEKTKAPPRE